MAELVGKEENIWDAIMLRKAALARDPMCYCISLLVLFSNLEDCNRVLC